MRSLTLGAVVLMCLHYATSQQLPTIDLSTVGFSPEELACPLPSIRILQNRMPPENIKTVLQATQAAVFTNPGLLDLNAKSLAGLLAEQLGGTWHAVMAVGPLDWHVKFDDNYFMSYQFGGIAAAVFRRDKKDEILFPVRPLQQFVNEQLAAVPDLILEEPATLQALVSVVQDQFKGNWLAAGALANSMAVTSTAGALYVQATRGKRIITLWSIDIPATQITRYIGAVSTTSLDNDLGYLQSLLYNQTDDVNGEMLDRFGDEYKGDWTALQDVSAFAANTDGDGLAVQVNDASIIGVVRQNFPSDFDTSKAKTDYIQTYVDNLAQQLSFINLEVLPQLISENMFRKFGGRWATSCGAKDQMKLKSTKDRIFETGALFGSPKKYCLTWLTSNNPPVQLGFPTSNMFDVMSSQAVAAIQRSLIQNAGNKEEVCRFIVNSLKSMFNGSWHCAVSDSLMSISVDPSLINFLWVQSPDWTIGVMQANVAAVDAPPQQQEFLRVAANSLVETFFKTAGPNPAQLGGGLIANPDTGLRTQLTDNYGQNWMTAIMIPDSYAIVSTADPFPLIKTSVMLPQGQFDVQALQLFPTVVIRDMQFVDPDKMNLCLDVANKYLQNPAGDAQQAAADLVKELGEALTNKYYSLRWNVFAGGLHNSSYSFWYDPPNWIVLVGQDMQVVAFSRNVNTNFNASEEEVNQGLGGLLDQIKVDATNFPATAAGIQKLISESTQIQWQATAGLKNSYQLYNRDPLFKVVKTVEGDYDLGVWLA